MFFRASKALPVTHNPTKGARILMLPTSLFKLEHIEFDPRIVYILIRLTILFVLQLFFINCYSSMVTDPWTRF